MELRQFDRLVHNAWLIRISDNGGGAGRKPVVAGGRRGKVAGPEGDTEL